MKLSDNASLEVLISAVDQIRNILGIEMSNYPIDLFSVIKNYSKLRVYQQKFSCASIGGFLMNQGWMDYAVIVINENNSYEDKNFALGHEIIHYFCHNADSIMSSTNFTNNRNPKEKQANEGSAELLIPAKLFIPEIITAIQIYNNKQKAFEETAKVYRVAPEVIKYRDYHLGLDNEMLNLKPHNKLVIG